MSDVTITEQSPDPPIEKADTRGLDVDAVFPEPSGWRDWSLRTVFGRTLADRLAPALVSGITLFLLAVWMGPLYTSLEESLADLTESFGDGFVSIFGDFATPAGWLNAELYSLMAPAVVIYIAVSSAASAFAREQEERSIGLLAANPVGRTGIAVEKAIAVFLHVFLVVVLCGLGTWLGIVIASLDVPASHVVAISAHLALFGFAVAAAAMLVAVVLGRRVSSMVITSGIAVVAYVWGSFAPLSDTLEGLAVMSPWYWYFGSDPLTNGFHVGHLALSMLLTIGLVIAATRRFDRQDLPG